MANKYLPQNFEKKWIEAWEKEKTYHTPEKISKEKKDYVLEMFPYPSGAGLHVGHVRIYTGGDVLARYFRMNGREILHPMGWDAFGLPAENAAIKAHTNPMDIVPKNIENFKRQMMTMGFSYDWSREFSTTDPEYYKWTQWLFIQFYKMGLLYKKSTPVYFCNYCKTGLAEEEVLSDGTHERCGKPITKKELPQWIFKITQYADRLLTDLKDLDWPKGILEMQKNWIGKKEGINIKYKVSSIEYEMECFTTRPDTNFGATFVVIAPEHEFVKKILDGVWKVEHETLEKIKQYVEQSKAKSDLERINESRKKTGAFTGFYAINDLNGKLMPIWISDFVLCNFGTGAVVGVPGHDIRDFEFAQEMGIEIIRVVIGKDGDKSPITKKEQVQEEDGKMINSDFLNGMDIHEATKKIMDYMVEKGMGKKTTSYHLRDWVFSRQRYWGEPIPMINCEKCGWQPVPEDQLPIKLPYVKSYEPTETGESPLANISEFVNTTCHICGGPAKRETDTMPNWAGSCWYFLKFAGSVNSPPEFFSSTGSPPSLTRGIPSRKKSSDSSANLENWKLKIENSTRDWCPVDWYIGGAEHAVLHLLYSRFWVKALQDQKMLNFGEPFKRLRNVGIVLAEDHRKMSKSFGNVVNPDDVVAEYGADTLRIYEMFMAPFNQEIAWSTQALQGAYRFLSRVWNLFQNRSFDKNLSRENSSPLVIKLNRTIIRVTRDMSEMKFNTAIAAMMEFVNDWEKVKELPQDEAKKFLQILAPFAPFIAEEIWRNVLGEKSSIHLSSWPKTEAVKETEFTIPVQINGKTRATVTVSDTAKDAVESKALKDEKVKKYLEGKQYKVIYVDKKIINFVITA